MGTGLQCAGLLTELPIDGLAATPRETLHGVVARLRRGVVEESAGSTATAIGIIVTESSEGDLAETKRGTTLALLEPVALMAAKVAPAALDKPALPLPLTALRT